MGALVSKPAAGLNLFLPRIKFRAQGGEGILQLHRYRVSQLILRCNSKQPADQCHREYMETETALSKFAIMCRTTSACLASGFREYW